MAGDASSCQHRLEVAHDLVAHQSDPTIDTGFDGLARHYATRTTVLASEARCWLWLGQPRKAVDVGESALASWPALRRRGSGLHALRIAQSTRSQRALLELERLDHSLAAAPQAPGAPEFRQALAGALT